MTTKTKTNLKTRNTQIDCQECGSEDVAVNGNSVVCFECGCESRVAKVSK